MFKYTVHPLIDKIYATEAVYYKIWGCNYYCVLTEIFNESSNI